MAEIRHEYEVITEKVKARILLTDAEVERLRRKFHGYISITRMDNLDARQIASELENSK